jgi:hypothetical protein
MSAKFGPDLPALTPYCRLRAVVWTGAMGRDEIVPTKPVLAGEDDALEMLREKMILARRDRIPTTMGSPRTRQGISVQVAGEAPGSLRWRNLEGRNDLESSVTDGQAEVGWRPELAGQRTELVLEARDGRPVARVKLSAEGVVEVEAAPGTQVRGWIGVECSPVDLAGLRPEEQALRFSWCLVGGAAVPADWRRQDGWRGGLGRRIDFPLGPGSSGTDRRQLLFQDQVTGCSMSCEVQ